jgi:hypothetical protein
MYSISWLVRRGWLKGTLISPQAGLVVGVTFSVELKNLLLLEVVSSEGENTISIYTQNEEVEDVYPISRGH